MAPANSIAADELGVTAIEYGLIADIVGIGIIAALSNVSSNLQGTFNAVSSNSSSSSK